MSEHKFFQCNPSGKAKDAPSELSALSVLCELLGKVDALERRIEALEKRCGKIAAFSYGDNDSRIKDHERRIEKMERKLNHKGGGE